MKLVFASKNKNKLEEIKSLIPNFISLLSLDEIGCIEELEETQNTIEGNAIQKANYIFKKFGYSCFADDTGLEIDALEGRPGVFSARYAGEKANSKENIQKVLSEMKDTENRKAHFKTIIALVIDGKATIFEGIINGFITKEERGSAGFGYDSIFVPAHHQQTFAEMDIETKNTISHRAIAMQKLKAFLVENKTA